MRRAIAISAFGLGSASPNPPVGCVVLDRHGAAVGEGYHRRKGESHAEVNALHGAGARAAGGTAVVTLEPCNHHGRTPPCHQALIDAGVSRVLVALIDPTSRGEGGVARLREAGVDVVVDVLADEARVVLGPWLGTLATSRPVVTWLYEHAADGPRPVSVDLLARFRVGVDVVVGPGGLAGEGVAGAHAPDAFRIPSLPDHGALAELFANGARSVLLHGEPGLRHLDDGLVDDVIVALPASEPSSSGAMSPLPSGFVLEGVERHAAGVLLRAHRTRDEAGSGHGSRR